LRGELLLQLEVELLRVAGLEVVATATMAADRVVGHSGEVQVRDRVQAGCTRRGLASNWLMSRRVDRAERQLPVAAHHDAFAA
jgi:hypothetical protein